jgi:hypothetical protein
LISISFLPLLCTFKTHFGLVLCIPHLLVKLFSNGYSWQLFALL